VKTIDHIKRLDDKIDKIYDEVCRISALLTLDESLEELFQRDSIQKIITDFCGTDIDADKAEELKTYNGKIEDMPGGLIFIVWDALSLTDYAFDLKETFLKSEIERLCFG